MFLAFSQFLLPLGLSYHEMCPKETDADGYIIPNRETRKIQKKRQKKRTDLHLDLGRWGRHRSVAAAAAYSQTQPFYGRQRQVVCIENFNMQMVAVSLNSKIEKLF